MSTTSTNPWANGRVCRSGPFPRRSIEIGAIVLAFIYWWPIGLALVAWNIVMFIFAKIFYVTVNRRRERIWSAMSKEQKEEYLATTKDSGNKRLDFRFAH